MHSTINIDKHILDFNNVFIVFILINYTCISSGNTLLYQKLRSALLVNSVKTFQNSYSKLHFHQDIRIWVKAKLEYFHKL